MVIMRVLLILDHAPDYREPFLRLLGQEVDLTVIAQPCFSGNLTPPEQRRGYSYKELRPFWFGNKFCVQPGVASYLKETSYDVYCVSLNMRHISLLLSFFRNPDLWQRWVWWGQVFGRNQSFMLKWLRHYALTRSAGCLTYTEKLAQEVANRFNITAASFNNTQALSTDFVACEGPEEGPLRFLFVGRCQPRKRLERLVDLAHRRDDVLVRLVGPGMERLDIPSWLIQAGRVQYYGRTTGPDLQQHFEWADLVANPGHAGLLVMNAAQHGKGIVIDRISEHAPEYYLAEEAEQPFIDFGDVAAVDQLVNSLLHNRHYCRDMGRRLQQRALEAYTVEEMVRRHVHLFYQIAQ